MMEVVISDYEVTSWTRTGQRVRGKRGEDGVRMHWSGEVREVRCSLNSECPACI